MITFFTRLQVETVVDFFHFDKNHKGQYCHVYTNPHKVARLQAPDRNLSAAEQCFSRLSRLRTVMNHMNRETFRFMLALQVHLARKSAIMKDSRKRRL